MKRKKPQNRRTSKRKPKARNHAPRTLRQYLAKPQQFQEMWNSVVHVISKMRSDRTSLTKASQEFNLDPGIVLKFGRPALRKQGNGRYTARPSDRLLRILALPAREGIREFATRDSRQASLIGEYWNAVHRYLETGERSALRRFDGKRVKDASGKKILLLTEPDELDRLGSAGVFSFETIYARTA